LISHNIKWFLGLSLAVHAVMLLGWQQTDHEAGNTGQALLLSITNRAGEAVRQTVPVRERQQLTTCSRHNSLPRHPALLQPASNSSAVRQ
jgi:hypothetical protein